MRDGPLLQYFQRILRVESLSRAANRRAIPYTVDVSSKFLMIRARIETIERRERVHMVPRMVHRYVLISTAVLTTARHTDDTRAYLKITCRLSKINPSRFTFNVTGVTFSSNCERGDN